MTISGPNKPPQGGVCIRRDHPKKQIWLRLIFFAIIFAWAAFLDWLYH